MNEQLGQKVTQLTAEINLRRGTEQSLRSRELFARSTIDALSAHICVLDETGRIIMTNRAWKRFAGANDAQADTFDEEVNYLEVCDGAAAGGLAEAGEFAKGIRDVMNGKRVNFTVEYPCHSPTTERWFFAKVSMFVIDGPPRAVIAHENITTRKQIEAALREQTKLLHLEVAQRRYSQELLEVSNRDLEARVASEVSKNRDKDRALMQNEKMGTLGQLAAGVAHEINNPMGYISSNLRLLIDYFEKIIRFDRIRQSNCLNESPCATKEIVAGSRNVLDIDYILKEGVDLINESLDGADQVKNIVLELKNFSRKDAEERQPMALDSCLKRALTIVNNEIKYVAAIRTEYSPVPRILCHPGQLNQVFLNLLVNAGQAITTFGEISVKCWHDESFVYASVSDTGSGMTEEVRKRIFDPFFTTKDMDKGTGLGLSISHEIIKKHQGEITVESEPGRGTTFTVKLPLIMEAG